MNNGYPQIIQDRIQVIEAITKALDNIDYVEAVDGPDSAWMVDTRTYGRMDDPSTKLHAVLMRVRMKKIGKAETRKRWGELTQIVHDICRKHGKNCDLFASQMMEVPLPSSKDVLRQGMIIIP